MGVLLRRYLALGAGLVLLVVGVVLAYIKDTRTIGGVLIGSGIAVAVAGYTQIVDADRRVREAGEAFKWVALEELIETRRMLYIFVASLETSEGGDLALAGTLAHALAHRSQLLTYEEAKAVAQRVVHPTQLGFDPKARAEVLIADITAKLGDEPRSTAPG